MKLNLHYVILTLSSVIFLTACPGPEPETVMGCTDPNSANYDPNATMDDGSCQYANWTKTNGPNGGNVRSIAVSESTIYAGTDIGVFLTTDLGNTWINVSNDLDGPLLVFSVAVSGSKVFAGTEYGLYVSSDHGSNWTPISINDVVYSVLVSGSTIFVGTEENGVFRSTDDGNTWTPINNGYDPYQATWTIAVDGANIYAGRPYAWPGFYVSIDNGNSWTPSYVSGDVLSIVTNGSNVFVGTEGVGVFTSSDNGNTWTEKNNGLTNLNVYTMAVSGTRIFAGTYGDGVFVSEDNGNSWTQFNEDLDQLDITSLTVSGDQIFAGTGSRVYKRKL